MTDDLAAFLAARLDEDEAAAKMATKFPHWHAQPWYDGQFLKDGRTERADLWGRPGMQFTGQGALDTVVADHIARHDPARVLREVAAGRALLADYLQAIDDYAEFDVIRINHLKRAVKWRAAVYSDHPDYRQEWAP